MLHRKQTAKTGERRTKPLAETPAESKAITGPGQRYPMTPERSRRPRWRVLPPDGHGECDYNPELEPAFADDRPHEFRRSAATYQAAEAIRLAKEYALLRPGTRRDEIKGERLKEVRAVAAAWNRLAEDLKKRRREF
jgi:hypothetical protein